MEYPVPYHIIQAGKPFRQEPGRFFRTGKGQANERERRQNTGGTIRRAAGLGREYGAKEQNQKKGGEETR